MKVSSIIIIVIAIFCPLISWGQDQTKLTEDTREFYSFGWNPAKNGQPIKPFSMTGLDGKKIESNNLKGKVVVLDFWATWCAPCRKLTKELSHSLERYYGDNFIMIGANYMESVKKGNPEKYWQEAGYTFPMTLNNDKYGKSVGAANPTVIVIDKDGIVRGQFDAYTDLRTEEIETLVWSLIEKPEISIDEVVMANRNKEYVKAAYLADQVMKKDTMQGKELIGEKFKALLRVSEWDAVDYLKKAISEAKMPKEMEGYLSDGGSYIAETTDLKSPKIYEYGAQLFEDLKTKYGLKDNFIVNDLQGRCYLRSGNKAKAVEAARSAVQIAESTNQHPDTISYLKGVLENYLK